MAAMHGPHHVAQNSTTYTLPGSNLATGAPATHLVTANGGAASPTDRSAFFSSAGLGFSCAPPHAARDRQTTAASGVRIGHSGGWKRPGRLRPSIVMVYRRPPGAYNPNP